MFEGADRQGVGCELQQGEHSTSYIGTCYATYHGRKPSPLSVSSQLCKDASRVVWVPVASTRLSVRFFEGCQGGQPVRKVSIPS